ncbi:MAG: hypothetical protein KA165_01510 [Saprospiraceae bacterium]|nr:hypothetical protein [Saprospiraceae bacterium]
MNKKRWIIGIAAVLLTVFAVKGIGWYRWSHLSTAEKAGTITEKMARRFDLTTEQKSRVYALNLEKIQAFETTRSSGHRDCTQYKQLHQQWKDGVRGVLTPEQQRKFRH